MWRILAMSVYEILRPFIKGIMRFFTKLCELQRICYATQNGYERTIRIERSLEKSRQLKAVNEALMNIAQEGRYTDKHSAQALEMAVNAVILIKKIKPTIHREFVRSMRFSLNHICSYRQLIFDIEHVRRIKFDPASRNHVEKLTLLWRNLKDSPFPGLVSNSWPDIGFQGDDPKTDFRGMGMLGLDNLVFFVTQFNNSARHVFSRSLHPKYGYSFAIVGINLTNLVCTLLRSGELKTHLYNAMRRVVGVDDFHKLYCYVFVEFDRLWLQEKPRDIMEFNRILKKFESLLLDRLKNEDCLLATGGAVQDV